jgi:class 3 adenylate cyclase
VEAPRLERRLVAILAADVEGYSRHMEHDEVATLATLSNHRLIFDGLIVSHHGRITNTAGDSVLAEFQSVVDAVDCAMHVQDGLAAANDLLEEARRLHFRIGINVGDVMVKDGDIFGDGVNIAARLESLAQAGGICVSRGVRDHLRKMGQYAFEDLGEQTVKNIAQPIRAFHVRKASDVGHPVSPLPVPAPSRPEEPPEFELAFWEAMKDSEDPAEFAAYLERYPAGAFAKLALARRQSLLEAPEGPSRAPGAEADTDADSAAIEIAFWESVKDSDNPAMYEAYLERYPEGAFAALAAVRLDELEKAANARS